MAISSKYKIILLCLGFYFFLLTWKITKICTTLVFPRTTPTVLASHPTAFPKTDLKKDITTYTSE